MLPPQRPTSPNLARRPSELNRIAHLRNIPRHRIPHPQQHIVGDHLRIVHSLFGIRRPRIRHVCILKDALPLRARLCLDNARHKIKQLLARLLVHRPPPIAVARISQNLRYPHHRRRNIHKPRVDAPYLYPIPVRALKHAIKRPPARRRQLKRPLLQSLPNHLRREQQRPRHYGSVHLAPESRLFPRVQRRRDTLARQRRSPHHRYRMRHMRRPRPKARLRRQDPHPRHHQILIRRLIPQLPPPAIRRYRAMHQTRVNAPQLIVIHNPLPLRRRREIIQRHIRLDHQPQKRVLMRPIPCWGYIQRNALLPPIPNHEPRRRALIRRLRQLHPYHPCPVIAQKHPRNRARPPLRQVNNRQSVKRSRHNTLSALSLMP